MKLNIVGIYDRGILPKERVHCRAEVDLDMSFIALLDTTMVSATEVKAGELKCYWFLPLKVQAGEHVVIYTRAGVANAENRADGSRYHFLFRGLVNTLYASASSVATLLSIDTWTTIAPPGPGIAPPSALSSGLFTGLGGGTVNSLIPK